MSQRAEVPNSLMWIQLISDGLVGMHWATWVLTPEEVSVDSAKSSRRRRLTSAVAGCR